MLKWIIISRKGPTFRRGRRQNTTEWMADSKSPSIPYYPSHPNPQTLNFLTTTLNLTAELSRECLSTHRFTPWGVLRRPAEIIGELFPMPMVSNITVPICDPLSPRSPAAHRPKLSFWYGIEPSQSGPIACRIRTGSREIGVFLVWDLSIKLVSKDLFCVLYI